jgi:hypothetical protein
MQFGDGHQSLACKVASLPSAIEACLLKLSTELDRLLISAFFEARATTILASTAAADSFAVVNSCCSCRILASKDFLSSLRFPNQKKKNINHNKKIQIG